MHFEDDNSIRTKNVHDGSINMVIQEGIEDLEEDLFLLEI